MNIYHIKRGSEFVGGEKSMNSVLNSDVLNEL